MHIRKPLYCEFESFDFLTSDGNWSLHGCQEYLGSVMQYHWIPEALRPYDVIFSFDGARERAAISEKLTLWIKSNQSNIFCHSCHMKGFVCFCFV